MSRYSLARIFILKNKGTGLEAEIKRVYYSGSKNHKDIYISGWVVLHHTTSAIYLPFLVVLLIFFFTSSSFV